MDSYVFVCGTHVIQLKCDQGSDFDEQIVLGSIVTRCPSIGIASSALAQLDSACELFEKAARGFRADRVLVGLNLTRSRLCIDR